MLDFIFLARREDRGDVGPVLWFQTSSSIARAGALPFLAFAVIVAALNFLLFVVFVRLAFGAVFRFSCFVPGFTSVFRLFVPAMLVVGFSTTTSPTTRVLVHFFSTTRF